MAISSADIRQQFINFFKEKGHHFVRSASVIPSEDPTLLFTNAGMNQFKPYFIGSSTSKAKRVMNFQKCIRVSGKHNDLEEVGVDDYHHTFFEMLGNWSFGDYYKKDAIQWAWELLTDIWELDKNRLWITIFQDDDESGKIWRENTDIPSERILKFGRKDNFWEMGETGPCGPCTEIHYYIGDDPENQNPEGVNSLAEYREIWNLVFIQYNRDENGELIDLPEKHVDTGAGFERLVAILNGKYSNYDSDLFTPIINEIQALCNMDYSYKEGVPHRVIADHLRMLAFSIADGAMPGNDGRGYVLRRVLRRASRYGKMLGMNEPFIFNLVDSLCETMGDAYPELHQRKKHIEKVIYSEEESFKETLDRGLEVYQKITKNIPKQDKIPGQDVFKLYDTYGFPLDLTELMAKEDGYEVDVDGFNQFMLAQKDSGRSSSKFHFESSDVDWIIISEEKPTDFLGYDKIETQSDIIKYNKINDHYQIVLDQTPFYAESGGQTGDTGYLLAKDFNFRVEDVQKHGDEYLHWGGVTSGNIKNIKNVKAVIDEDRRKEIRKNHTATHLLHQALKDILGDHVQQAGSLVAEKYLRFDLTHYEQITAEQIKNIENSINSIILKNQKVETKIKSYSDAQEEGAISLFGEKYEDMVRVVNVPGFSKELCGGTHVDRTGEIGGVKITNETALAAGVRRITAVSGKALIELINSQDKIIQDIKKYFKCSNKEILIRIESLMKDNKTFEKENKKIKRLVQTSKVNELVNSADQLGEVRLVVTKLDDIVDLKGMGDQFRQTFQINGIALVGTVYNGKPMVMCTVTDDLISEIKAGKVVKEIGTMMGGGGGGKDHLATAGGTDASHLNDILDKGREYIKSLLK